MVTRASILDQVLSRKGDLPPEVARFFLSLDFPAEIHARTEELSEKARQGTITPDEHQEMERYLEVNALLAMFRAHAHVSLKNQTSAV